MTRGKPRKPAKKRPPRPEGEEAAISGLSATRLWPGRTMLYVREVAEALHVTEQHVVNLITEGRLRAISIARTLGRGARRPRGKTKTRRESWRIPANAWDVFIRENAS